MPDLPPKVWLVLDSARRFPTIFPNMRPIDPPTPPKDRVLSGPKQILVKWGHYAAMLFSLFSARDTSIIGGLIGSNIKLHKQRP